MTAPRVGLDPDGSLDEFVSRDVESLHFEAMGVAQFCRARLIGVEDAYKAAARVARGEQP